MDDSEESEEVEDPKPESENWIQSNQGRCKH
jgi:hypothetical protein